MPTKKARHMVTETPDVVAALDAAARQWPADRDARSKLLGHLIREGHASLEAAHEVERQRQLQSIQDTAGALTGVYPKNYLAREREDWPE